MNTVIGAVLVCEGVEKLVVVDNVKHDSSFTLLSIGTRASHDIALWDIQRSHLEFSVDVGHSVDFAVISVPSNMVVCGSADSGVVVTISLTSGSVDRTSKAKGYCGMADMAISVNSIFIATPASGVVVLSLTQDVVTGSLQDPDGPSVPTKLLVSSRNDGQLIVGYKHGLVHIFNVDTETVICSMSGHSARVTSLHLLPSGQLISAADDQSAIIWNSQLPGDQQPGNEFAGMSRMCEGPETGDEVLCSSWESEECYDAICYTVNSTQHLLYAGFICGVVKVWNIDTGQSHFMFTHLYTWCAKKNRIIFKSYRTSSYVII